MHFHRMAVYPECTWLFFACLCQLVSVGGSFLQPCEPINETISVEKDGCPTCLVLQTSICSGHCITKDPSYKSPLSTVYQRVCTYRDVRYETVRLPDCRPGVDPLVTFPVALSCDCSQCTMDTSDCSIHSLRPDFCISQTAVLMS